MRWPFDIPQLAVGFGQFVRDQQRGHHQEAIVADLPHAGDEFQDFLVNEFGEPLEMLFLARIAGNLIAAAVDRNTDLRHLKPPALGGGERSPGRAGRRPQPSPA